ncbi:MAG: elongation factor P [Candidatus Harrisonbacteria bacterium CG10_big_fil_rev_8_21_14_0_10_40_38]|uniref:Elongation factor P n=1 Tax=Candidatus Harrisonbacteria bacterium CG10_big_fil_rev_8_21_14_0_10_40_38 TaxID=1974583 RepID=A0A2H0UU79_9BACT|nr:MAG: elongation factor P [Candidatus Harrisonbacteria bacterium CG10_big_fil_rev_8_21_14_0_10_40_38]
MREKLVLARFDFFVESGKISHMLSYTDLKKGVLFVMEGQPYQVLEYEFLRMQQRKPVAKTKIRNLITGKIAERSFHMNESFDEADIEKRSVKFLYSNKGEFWFCEIDNPSARFSLGEDIIGTPAKFLKQNTEVTADYFDEKIINIEVPVKLDLEVKETPPGIRGDTASGGSKPATLETGAIVNVPFFVNVGDVVRVNTETGSYVERVEKASS